jgi:VWFA-related protein
MTRGAIVLFTTVMALWTSAGLQGQQPSATFRSGVDVVAVPVWVTSGNRPVSGLTASDFRLFENGVVQDLSLASVESLPIDVTVVLDASGSVTGPALEQFKSDIQEVARTLRPADRVRVILFAVAATDLSGWQAGGRPVSLDSIESGGLTAFYNAIAAALLSSAQSDRPHLVVGFSDGLDTASFLDADDVISLAGASTATLYLVLSDQVGTGGPILGPYIGGPAFGSLREAVARTGGSLYRQQPKTALPASFRQVLQDFRSGYLLSYTPRAVVRGWRDITVRTVNADYTVRARKGYEGR